MKLNYTEPDYDRPLPERIDTERMVLGAALTDVEAFPQILDLLSAEDFSIEKHQRLYRAMNSVFARGETVTYISVGDELLKLGQAQSVGVEYVFSLADGMPHVVDLARMCELIRGAAVRRQAIVSMSALINQCFDSGHETSDLLAAAERVTEILNATSARSLAVRTVEQVIEDEGGINSFLAPEKTPGIAIPFATIHDTLSGLRRSKFIIIGARPAVGKTALAAQIAEHAANIGKRVLWVTLEMSARDVLQRSVTGRAEVNAHRFRHGSLSERERDALQEQTSALIDYGTNLLLADDSDTTVQGLSRLLRSLAARNEAVDLCIVDYLQLLSSIGNHENRVQEVSKISRELKKMSKAFDIPVVALAQLRRTEEHRKLDMPQLDWLKESGQLEQDADQVLFLWLKKEPEQGELLREVHWRVAKNRDGILNHGVLSFQTKYCRFNEERETGRAVA